MDFKRLLATYPNRALCIVGLICTLMYHPISIPSFLLSIAFFGGYIYTYKYEYDYSKEHKWRQRLNTNDATAYLSIVSKLNPLATISFFSEHDFKEEFHVEAIRPLFDMGGVWYANSYSTWVDIEFQATWDAAMNEACELVRSLEGHMQPSETSRANWRKIVGDPAYIQGLNESARNFAESYKDFVEMGNKKLPLKYIWRMDLMTRPIS